MYLMLAGTLLLLGGAHGIHEAGLGVLLLHLAVQGHHALVPLTERGAQLTLATFLLAGHTTLLTLFTSAGCVGHLVFY